MGRKINILILAAALGLGLFSPVPARSEKAPDLSLITLEGQPWQLADHRGRVVLLNFFTPWCKACRTEAANLMELKEELGPRGLTIIGLAYFADPQKVLKYLDETKIGYPVAIYGDNVKQTFGMTDSVPISFLVDRQGNLVGKITGLISKAVLRDKLLEFLNAGQ